MHSSEYKDDGLRAFHYVRDDWCSGVLKWALAIDDGRL